MGATVTLEQTAWGQAGQPSWVSLSPGSVFGLLLSQKPSRDICQRGTSVVIQCQLDSQVSLMFWYRQLPGQSLTLIATANQGFEATYERGFTKDKFPISRPNLMLSLLTVSNVLPEDSSFYFCSAEDTVLSTYRTSEQEPQAPGQLPAPPAPLQAGGRKPQLPGGDSSLCLCGWVRT